MPLSAVQKGAIGQFAVLAIALATGNGQVEVYIPAADNEGRDAEVRRHLSLAAAISIQIKVAFSTDLHHGIGPYLSLRFRYPEKMVPNDPRLWFVLGAYSRSGLGLHDPLFVVPATFLRKLARRGKRKGILVFSIEASLDPRSHDEFSPYRVALKDLGKRLLEIIDENSSLKANRLAAALPIDGVWVSRMKFGMAKKGSTTALDRKYALLRTAVVEQSSITAWYKGHRRAFSPFVLGTKSGEPHVLGYQFGGTSEKPLAPDGSPANWRCLCVSDLTKVKVLPGVWHAAQKGKAHQRCIDHVDVSAYRPSTPKPQVRRAA